MVEETIQAIRETEKKADEIVKNAHDESERIIQEAREKASELSEKIISSARSEALAAAERAKENGSLADADALAESEDEIRSLKASAMERKKEAVNLVISQLA